MHTRLDRRRAAMVNLGNLGFQGTKSTVSDKGPSTQSNTPFASKSQTKTVGVGLWRASQLASAGSGR